MLNSVFYLDWDLNLAHFISPGKKNKNYYTLHYSKRAPRAALISSDGSFLAVITIINWSPHIF